MHRTSVASRSTTTILSPQGRKRSNSTQDDVATVEKFQFTEDFDHVDKISIKAKRRSRGRRDLASLAMTFRQEDYASITLIADGAGTYLAGSTLPRTDPKIWTTVGAPSDERVAQDIAGWEMCAKKSLRPRGALCQMKISAPVTARERFLVKGSARLNCRKAIERAL